MGKGKAALKTGTNPGQRILVIKLGAFGDMLIAAQAFQAIQAFHKDAEITLLTTPPFAELGRLAGKFDHVIAESRQGMLNSIRWLKVARKLRRMKFSRIYDLQNVFRSVFLFFVMGAHDGPEWCGSAPGAKFFIDRQTQKRSNAHAYEKHKEQLRVAGVHEFPPVSLDWLASSNGKKFSTFANTPYALLVPGSAAKRPEKRWSAQKYCDLAQGIKEKGITPVLIGGDDEREELALIKQQCPDAINLGKKTNFKDLAWLARHAALAVGNDTGPMHLFALSGCPCLTLFGPSSYPDQGAPRSPDSGGISRIIRVDSLDQLHASTVLQALPIPRE